MLAGFKMAQIVSIIMIVVGIIIIYRNLRKNRFEDLYNDKDNIDHIRF